MRFPKRVQFPRQYTVLIAKTGQIPTTLKVHPLPWVLALGVLASIPCLWVGNLIQRNSELAQRNEELTDTANEVLTELESLDAEIDSLKERAGLEEETVRSSRRSDLPQGGPMNPVAAEQLFDRVQRRLPSLESTLEADVRPALEATLAAEAKREAAFPSGKPLQGEMQVSSEFGLRRNPFGGRNYEMHEGIDFRGPVGRPVYATASGEIKKATSGNGYGKHVIIDHGYSYETLYAHLSDLAVESGRRVRRGDLIGYLGSTGRSSGPHLHYGIYRSGQPVNPRYYLKLEDPTQ